jgi:hypothetical protein
MNKMRVVPEWQTYLPHVLAIALLIAVSHTMAYYDEMEDAKEQAHEMSAAMASCLNGTYRATSESGTQIGCMPAVTFEQHERTAK